MIGWSTGVTPGGRWLRLPRLFPKARANTQLSEQLNLTVIADHLDDLDLFKLRLGMNAIGGHFRTHINSVSPLLPLRSYEAQAFARAMRILNLQHGHAEKLLAKLGPLVDRFHAALTAVSTDISGTNDVWQKYADHFWVRLAGRPNDGSAEL